MDMKTTKKIKHSRSHHLAVALGAAIGVMVAGAQAQAQAAEDTAARKPNVVLVITDDQGYGDLSCHGNPVLKTPNIDRMFAQSVRLVDFHVAPTCSQTRAGLMTGHYCNRTGVWHTIMGRSLLGRDEVTMADVFAASGYRTGIFGKWHLGDNYPFRPQDRGFQESLVHKGGGVGNTQDYWGNDYFDDTYFRNGRAEKFEGYCTDIWFDGALQFIEANKDRPFFCYLTTNAPHSPFRVPPEYSQPYKDQGLKESLANFFGMIASIDENFGRLSAKLDELGLAENTIFIFMTDNGATSAGRRQGDFNAGMRGWKGSHYDGGHRVPCFIRWPERGLSGGRDVDRIAANVDLLPTLIELCHLEQPEGVAPDGMSIVPLLFGQATDWPDRTFVVDNQRIDYLAKNRRPAVMTDRWRLVNGHELYDIEQDPGQRRDVAREYPEVVQRLQAEYETWWASVSAHADEYPRIVIGSDQENLTVLSSHDIHGEVTWNQNQVRAGKRCDGFWAIDVARDGEYEFALRRWPESSGAAITEAAYGGRAIRATNARLLVDGFDQTKTIEEGAALVTFRVPLTAGNTRLQAWFADGREDGKSTGVYYVSAKRLE